MLKFTIEKLDLNFYNNMKLFEYIIKSLNLLL